MGFQKSKVIVDMWRQRFDAIENSVIILNSFLLGGAISTTELIQGVMNVVSEEIALV